MTKIRLSTKLLRTGNKRPLAKHAPVSWRGRCGAPPKSKKMKIIKFIDTCDMIIEDTFSIIEGNFDVERTYYAGDEDEIMEVLEVDDESSKVFFMDGRTAIVPTDCFVIFSCEDDEDESNLW